MHNTVHWYLWILSLLVYTCELKSFIVPAISADLSSALTYLQQLRDLRHFRVEMIFGAPLRWKRSLIDRNPPSLPVEYDSWKEGKGGDNRSGRPPQ